MANNDGKIVLGLDMPKTVSQINADIKKLQKQLTQIKLTGALDTSSTVKQINAQIAALQSQLKTVDIKANVNTSVAEKVEENVGKTVDDSAQKAIDGIINGVFDGLQINVEDYSDALKKIKGLQAEDIFIDNKVNVDAFAEAAGTSDDKLIGYVETLNTAKGKIDLTTVSTEGLSEYLKKTGNSFNFAALKASLLNTALNAGVSLAVSIALQAVAKGLDNFINRAKYAKEAMEEAQSAIDSSQNNLKSMSDMLSNNRERFLELSQGVDKFSKNLSLSEEDYAEYLSLSNQLAELSPSLISGYDEQGNALLAIGGSADETNEKLQSVLETQQAIAQQTLLDNMDAVANGIYFEVKDKKNSIAYMKSQLSDLQQQYKEINIDIVNSNGLFNFNEESYSKYGKILEDAFTSAGVEFEKIIGLYNTGIQLASASPEQLNRAQNFYDAQIESEKEYYRASEIGLKQDIEEKEKTFETSYAKINANLQAWMKANYNYQYLSDNASAMADALVPEIKWDELEEPPMTAFDYQNYVAKNIIEPLMEVPLDYKNEADNMFQKLLSFEDGDLDVLRFAEQLQKKINEWNVDIDITPIIADEKDAKERLQNSIESIAQGSDYYTSSGNHVDAEDHKRLQEYTEGFTVAQVEFWLEATRGAENATQAIDMYKAALAEAKEPAKEPIALSISETIEQLNTQLKPAMDLLKSTYQDIFTDDGFKLNSIDMLSTCDSIKSKLDEMSEVGLDVDYSSYENFVKVLRNSESKSQDVEDAIDSLATSITQAALSGAEDFETMKAALEDLGVVNEELVAFDALISNTEALKEAGLDLVAVSQMEKDEADEAIANFANETVSAENVSQAIEMLTFQKELCGLQDMNTANEVANLLTLAENAGYTGEIIEQLTELEQIYQQMASGILTPEELDRKLARAAELEAAIKESASNIKYEPSVDFSNAAQSAGISGKSAGSTYVDAFEKELEDLQQLKEDGIITEKEYLDRLRALNEKYFKDKLGYEKEFSKYQRQYLEGYKSLYESALSGISKLLSRQIDGYNDAKDSAVSSLTEEKEARLEVIDTQKEQLEAEKGLIDEQINQKQKIIDQIQDEIQKMKDANDERKRQLDLQKAQYELERMQHQRTMLVNYMPGTIVI